MYYTSYYIVLNVYYISFYFVCVHKYMYMYILFNYMFKIYFLGGWKAVQILFKNNLNNIMCY